MAEQPNNDAGQQQRTPPIIPLSTLQNFLDPFEEDTIPTQIDKSIMTKLPWGSQTSLISALKYLDFISDDNVPGPLLTEYVTTDKDSRGPLWNRILKSKYAFLLDAVDIGRTTTEIVVAKFKAQGLNGDSIRKAMTFFLHAAKIAGIQVSPHVKAPRPPQGPKKTDKGDRGGKTKDTADTVVVGGKGGGSSTSNQTSQLPYMLVDLLGDKNMTAEQETAVLTVIRYLKAKEA